MTTWDVARGSAPLLVAAALWAWLLAGVAAPLGATLASVHAAQTPAPTAVAGRTPAPCTCVSLAP